jgi:hypothetical protein
VNNDARSAARSIVRSLTGPLSFLIAMSLTACGGSDGGGAAFSSGQLACNVDFTVSGTATVAVVSCKPTGTGMLGRTDAGAG